jgi:predicted HD phosphohydrolase
MTFRFLTYFVLFFGTTRLLALDSQLYSDIKTMFALYGNDKYMISEEIIQRSHVLQAALIAKLSDAPEDVIIALMLHDIGQIAEADHVGQLEYLHANHDEVGAAWLKSHGFPPFVTDFVRYHTIVKVLLCMEDPHYFENLSLASQESYFIQRDKYLNEEGQKTLNTLLNHPRLEDIKCARKCDDMAKIIGLNEKVSDDQALYLPSFDAYFDMALRVCQGKEENPGHPHWRDRVNDNYHFMTRDRQQFENSIKAKVAKSLNPRQDGILRN